MLLNINVKSSSKVIKHTHICFITRFLEKIATAKVDEFDLRCACVDQEVFQFDIHVENSPSETFNDSISRLLHDAPG